MIRKALKKDINQCNYLMLEYSIHEDKLAKKIIDYDADFLLKESQRFIVEEGFFTFVYEKKHKIIGLINGDIRFRGKYCLGTIHNLIVTKNERGNNVGSRLVEYVLDFFKKNKCISVRSFVLLANKKALEFWTKKGFSSEKGFNITKNLLNY